ncbi:P-loop containing nucleoside triphosphate hydrolase protein, partial [Rhypophila sp. PSN 637]
YEERRIRYRRGYIFYGLSGNGKTSFDLAIACYFGLPLYILHLGELQLNELRSLLSILPTYCVLLLEDIDSVHFRGDGAVDSGEARHGLNKKGISLLDLLNAVDGIDSPKGRVLIATANNPESLPNALTRPGRFDQRVAFLDVT